MTRTYDGFMECISAELADMLRTIYELQGFIQVNECANKQKILAEHLYIKACGIKEEIDKWESERGLPFDEIEGE